MARTQSSMLALGTEAPAFSLPDTEGRVVSRDDLAGSPALLVIFMCNHCPYVRHVRHELVRTASDLQAMGVTVVGINSNDPDGHPDDSPEMMAKEVAEVGYTFPYLFDETQEVARAYRAACTPDFFLFDADRRLAYRGQMDASRPGNEEPVTGADLRAAADAVVSGQPVPEPQLPSMGCNVKWRPGNEPQASLT